MANLDVIIDVVVVDLLGCASLRSKRDAKTEQNLPLAERRTYSLSLIHISEPTRPY